MFLFGQIKSHLFAKVHFGPRKLGLSDVLREKSRFEEKKMKTCKYCKKLQKKPRVSKALSKCVLLAWTWPGQGLQGLRPMGN